MKKLNIKYNYLIKDKRNNRSGFSLIETVISLLIASIVMTALFNTQFRLISAVSSAHNVLNSTIDLKNYIIDAHRDRWFSKSEEHKKILKNEDLAMSYKTASPNEGIIQSLNTLVVETVTLNRDDKQNNIIEKIVTFKFNLPKK